MKCNTCNNLIDQSKKKCIFCAEKNGKVSFQKNKKETFLSILVGLVVLVAVGIEIFSLISGSSVLDLLPPKIESFVSKALDLEDNAAIEAFESGDYKLAEIEMDKQLAGASSNSEKVNILKNKAYLYSSDLQNEKAMDSFEKALSYVQFSLFEEKLIKGEIEYLKNNFGSAEILYLEAYRLRKNDFQINNALSLFYLDLDDTHSGLVDYEKGLEFAIVADKNVDSEFKNSALQNLAIAHYYNDNHVEALEILAEQDQDNPYNLYWIGLVHASSGEDLKAVSFFERSDSYDDFQISDEIEEYISFVKDENNEKQL